MDILLRNRLAQSNNTRFRKRIVRLSRITVNTGGTRDIDNIAGFAVFDTEVGCCCSDKLEGCGVVDGEDGVPLFIGHLCTSSAIWEEKG